MSAKALRFGIFALLFLQFFSSETAAVSKGACAPNKFQCGDGTCLKSLKLKCDGDKDCPDGSDEDPKICSLPVTTIKTTTPSPVCSENQFQCGDLSCIKLKFKCDGDADCPDGEDESPETCSSTTSDSVQPPAPNKAINPEQPESEVEASNEDTQEFALGDRTADDGEVIAEAERLIQAGDDHIEDDEKFRNVILLVGNSGAGKSTLGKILTTVDDAELTSIPAGDRFIIRDREGRISGRTSTVISKSIFPKLLVNPSTGDAYYDLPGFGDTRGPGVEMGNADFMKRVADRARRVKILIVVNYSSLKSGEIRTDFRNLLESLLDYVPNLADPKFKPGIVLVANKVEPEMGTEIVIPAMVQFLKSARESLPTIFGDDAGKRESAKALLDLLLTKEKKGTSYARLGFFKTPDREGPLSTIPSVQAARTVLNRILSTNTLFVTKAVGDFDLSVSPNTRLFLFEAVLTVQRNVARGVGEMAGELLKYFDQKTTQSKTLQVLQGFKADWLLLKNKSIAMTEIAGAPSTGSETNGEKITSILTSLSQDLKLDSESETEVTSILENVEKQFKNLAFLEPFLEGKTTKQRQRQEEFGGPPIELILKSCATQLLNLVRNADLVYYNLCQEVNDALIATFQDLGQGIREVYREKLDELYESISETGLEPESETEATVAEYQEVLQDDLVSLKGLVKTLDGMTSSATVFQFCNESLDTLSQLGIGIPENTFEDLEQILAQDEGDSSLTETLKDWTDRRTPFTPAIWTRTVTSLVAFLETEIQSLLRIRRETLHDGAKGEMKDDDDGAGAEGGADFDTKHGTAISQVETAEGALLQVRAEMEALAEKERELLESTAAEDGSIDSPSEI